MNKRRCIHLLLVVIAVLSHARAQTIRRHGCSVDAEVFKLPDCAVTLQGGQLFVLKPFVRPFLRFSRSSHLAAAILPDGHWAYFNLQGRVVVRDVAMFDNGVSDFHLGLVRVLRQGKYGLADMRGRIVVPAVYDVIYEPEPRDKDWKANIGCHSKRVGEYESCEGGDQFSLNRFGVRRSATN